MEKIPHWGYLQNIGCSIFVMAFFVLSNIRNDGWTMICDACACGMSMSCPVKEAQERTTIIYGRGFILYESSSCGHIYIYLLEWKLFIYSIWQRRAWGKLLLYQCYTLFFFISILLTVVCIRQKLSFSNESILFIFNLMKSRIRQSTSFMTNVLHSAFCIHIYLKMERCLPMKGKVDKNSEGSGSC